MNKYFLDAIKPVKGTVWFSPFIGYMHYDDILCVTRSIEEKQELLLLHPKAKLCV